MERNEFIKLWNEADTVGEVVKATGLKYDSVVRKAFRLRHAGFPVKKFDRPFSDPQKAREAGKIR